MSQRNFSNTAVETQLVVPVDDTAGSFVVASTTGWPVAPFTIIIDPDQPEEEVCLVTFVSGSTLTVTRGYDSTVALPHASGAAVKHGAIAIDFREANLHVNAVDAVHGVLGDIVGTSDNQTLTNKAISGSNNTITDIPQSSVTGLDDSLALKANLAGPTTFTGTISLPSTTSIGSVSSAEIANVDGSRSNLQDQIDALDAEVDTKAPINSPTFTGTVNLPSSTIIGTVSAGELAALDGVVGNLQSQINGITGGGASVPVGGLTDYILVKNSAADYDMAWKPVSDFIYIPGSGGGDFVVPDGSITGGDSTGTYTVGAYTFRWHKFTTTGVTGSLVVTVPVIGQVLIVGGGGAGGYSGATYGGGGGGGGSVWEGDYALGTGTHNVIVGAGALGASGNTVRGSNGGNTRFDDIICYGGGAGGSSGSLGNYGACPGADGGSGGGGGRQTYPGGAKTGGSLDGGATSRTDVFFSADGEASGTQGGRGGGASTLADGFGRFSSISGTTLEYGKGGGGTGGSAPAPATQPANSGNGGNGGTDPATLRGGPGADGVVVVRYRIA